MQCFSKMSGDLIVLPVYIIIDYHLVCRYMKGRVSYDQLNAAVNCINLAVATKYKIVQKSVKTLNGHSRNLHQRFKEQETKDTKGTVKIHFIKLPCK